MNNIRRLAFIGGGNMAAALIGGLIQARACRATAWWSRIRARSNCSAWSAIMAVKTAADNASAVKGAEVVILAVKPQHDARGRFGAGAASGATPVRW